MTTHVPSKCNSLAAIAGFLATVAAYAGPLTPGAGPVASTYKTLTEVEPRIAINITNTPGQFSELFRITQPGSYYLTGNITGVSGKDGIRIVADGVTLDLNGFVIIGVVNSNTGINVDPGSSCTIRNGSVRNWGGAGIDSFRNGTLVENINSSNNVEEGIRTSNASRVVNCLALNNDGRGILVGNESVVTGCVAQGNFSAGSFVGGIYSGDRCVITECTAAFNAGAGITVGAGSRVSDCQAGQNTNGFESYGSALFAGCTARENDSDGFHVGAACTVRDSESTGNGDDGIEAATRCVITGNTCDDNGPAAAGAGVFLTGSSCRVEDNKVSSNFYGVLTGGSVIDCFIVKNTARGNTNSNFSINPGNELAPVITNPGLNSFSTMTPWSNVAF